MPTTIGVQPYTVNGWAKPPYQELRTHSEWARDCACRWTSGWAMVPDNVRERWEVAYREYARACAVADQSTSDCDRSTARWLAAASRRAAADWAERATEEQGVPTEPIPTPPSSLHVTSKAS